VPYLLYCASVHAVCFLPHAWSSHSPHCMLKIHLNMHRSFHLLLSLCICAKRSAEKHTVSIPTSTLSQHNQQDMCLSVFQEETPLEEAKRLSEELGNTILLKREDLQPVHSFKVRGAFNRMSQMTEEQMQKGVICASAGNHAQGVALAALKLVSFCTLSVLHGICT